MPEKGSSSPLHQRHVAEAKKFEAETKALEMEALSLETEARLNSVKVAREEMDFDDELYHHRFENSSDNKNRTFSMVGEIDDDTIDDLVDKVNAWARMSDKPIVVRLNSPGGSVYAGLALYDQLKAVDMTKAPVYTVALGMTASMAGIIFQAGRKRIISPNATFLIHEVQVHGLSGNRSELEDVTKQVQRLNTRLYSILSERSTLSVEEIDKNAQRKDWEIDADEAVKLGFADEKGYI